jgi:hypothetical protein
LNFPSHTSKVFNWFQIDLIVVQREHRSKDPPKRTSRSVKMKSPHGNKKPAGGCETQAQAELGIEIGQQRLAPN